MSEKRATPRMASQYESPVIKLLKTEAIAVGLGALAKWPSIEILQDMNLDALSRC